MFKSIKIKVRHLIEALASVFLFLFQHIPVAGPWYGHMLFPLATYLFGTCWLLSPEYREYEFDLLFLSPKLMFGRIVAIVGFIIFLTALIHFLMKRGKLITSGLYSVVRHPQYLGIIITTYGITMMCFQYAGTRSDILMIWLIEVLGYILLAGYEERHLLIERGEEYRQYKQKVSFIFPTPRISKFAEPILSLITLLIMFYLVTLI